MATEFKLPELGENVDSGDLVRLLVSEGDTVEKDQPVLELETEKATIEVPSTVAGKIKKIHVEQGAKIKVGDVILTVEDGAAAKEEKKEEKKEAKAEAKPEPEKKEKPAPEPREARKEETAPEAKREERRPAAAAEKEPEEKEEPEKKEAAPRREPPPRETPAREERPRPAADAAPAAPSVRRLARELGVEIGDVPGSGPGGRISVDDVKAYARQLIESGNGAHAEAAPGAAPAVELPDFSRWGEVERQRMSSIRRTTARRLAAAWQAPHVTQFDRADVTVLEEMRKQLGPKAEAAGGKLTVTAIVLKVVAEALKKFPQCAASVDMAREEIVYKKYTHIGVAVDTDRGLLVPVIRDVDRKDLFTLARELGEAAEKARSRKLAPDDMAGGVFTITNLGGIGGTNFSPIVNAPEVAILGLARSSWEPVYRDGQLQPRLVLPLALSYDHRLVDGADAARFLRWVAEALEKPFLLFV